MDFLEADKFVLFILFVVPGFVCLKTYQVITPGRHRDAAQQLIDAVAYSCVNYALLAFPIFWVEQSGLRTVEPTVYFAFWVFAILAAPVIWACLYRYLRRRRFLQRLLPHPTEAAWDFVFERKQPWWVIATLTDGRRIAGRYDGDSFTSSAPCAKLQLFGHSPFRGVISRMWANEGVASVDTDLPIRNKPSAAIEVPVVALDGAPGARDAEQLWDLACDALGSPPPWISWNGGAPGAPQKVRAIGLMYPDELQWRQQGSNLTLVIQRREVRAAPDGKLVHSVLARIEFESAVARQARIPELTALRDKKVALFGVGALGSFVAVELARAGVGRLALVDSDSLESGNTVRWALGRHYAGISKVQSLYMELSNAYPHTEVQRFHHRLGIDDDPERNEEAILDKILAGADVIVDATASLPINLFLADLAAERGLPYVWLSTTNGAWGGMVGRIRHNSEACWLCHRHRLQPDGDIVPPVAKPGDFDVQPAGCLDPTYTGTAFDSSEVVLQAVRLVSATLCSNSPGGYPDYPWDIGTVDLRTPDGQVIPPKWTTYSLRPHPSCCDATVD